MRVLIFLWGVGWGSLKTFHVHFHTYAMLRCYAFWCISHPSVMLCYYGFSCAFTHTTCYAIFHFHTCVMQRYCAFSRMRHAARMGALLHFHTYVMLCYCAFSCTSTRASCYATVRSFAPPHIRHATLLCVLVRFHAYVKLLCCFLHLQNVSN